MSRVRTRGSRSSEAGRAGSEGELPWMVNDPEVADAAREFWQRAKERILSLSWDSVKRNVYGVGDATIKKLSSAFGHPIEVLMAGDDELGVSESVARGLKRFVVRSLMPEVGGFITVSELRRRIPRPRLTTCSSSLDRVVDIRAGDIVLLYGLAGVGKTQFCLQLSVNVMMRLEHGGLEGIALYIDTESLYFPTERVQAMYDALKGMGVEFAVPEPTIAFEHVRDPDLLIDVVRHEVPKLIVESWRRGTPVRLVVIDSITAPFREKYHGREQLKERQSKLMTLLGALKTIASALNIVVVCTSQTYAVPMAYVKTPYSAVGGNVLYHNVFKIVRLERHGGKRVAVLEKGPKREESAEFSITDEGIRDASGRR